MALGAALVSLGDTELDLLVRRIVHANTGHLRSGSQPSSDADRMKWIISSKRILSLVILCPVLMIHISQLFH